MSFVKKINCYIIVRLTKQQQQQMMDMSQIIIPMMPASTSASKSEAGVVLLEKSSDMILNWTDLQRSQRRQKSSRVFIEYVNWIKIQMGLQFCNIFCMQKRKY